MNTIGITEVYTISTPEVYNVVVEIQSPTTILAGSAGITGASGNTVTGIASIDIGGNRAVLTNSSNKIIYADNTIISHANKVLGITTRASVTNDIVSIQTGGEYSESTWNWVLDSPIWLSTNGLLTQSTPTVGFSQIIGFPITSTKIFINLREPLVLV